MKILGVETSCDETAASVVENGQEVFSNVVSSSQDLHAETGGIVPENAARQQVKAIVPVVSKALENAFPDKIFARARNKKLSNVNTKSNKALSHYHLLISKNIDAIAITYGPGLIGSLLVGVETAKTLSWITGKPIVPVNHLVAHIYAAWLKTGGQQKIVPPEFPALALVVSGGHTDLVIVKNHGNIRWLGGTRDDAAGETFDKCARILGLPYPGGPSISEAANKYLSENEQHEALDLFPRPMIKSDDYDFSFSGLKTSAINYVRKEGSVVNTERLAAEIQEAICEVLVEKTLRAFKVYKPKSLILAGGVSANKRLKKMFARRIKDELLQDIFHVPQQSYSTDNAAMVAACAYYNFHPIDPFKITAVPQLTITGES